MLTEGPGAMGGDLFGGAPPPVVDQALYFMLACDADTHARIAAAAQSVFDRLSLPGSRRPPHILHATLSEAGIPRAGCARARKRR